jgi:hypothetical protein
LPSEYVTKSSPRPRGPLRCSRQMRKMPNPLPYLTATSLRDRCSLSSLQGVPPHAPLRRELASVTVSSMHRFLSSPPSRGSGALPHKLTLWWPSAARRCALLRDGPLRHGVVHSCTARGLNGCVRWICYPSQASKGNPGGGKERSEEEAG